MVRFGGSRWVHGELRGVRGVLGVQGVSGSLTVVEGDDVQAVEQLPLVLVDPLDLDVEE